MAKKALLIIPIIVLGVLGSINFLHLEKFSAYSADSVLAAEGSNDCSADGLWLEISPFTDCTTIVNTDPTKSSMVFECKMEQKNGQQWLVSYRKEFYGKCKEHWCTLENIPEDGIPGTEGGRARELCGDQFYHEGRCIIDYKLVDRQECGQNAPIITTECSENNTAILTKSSNNLCHIDPPKGKGVCEATLPVTIGIEPCPKFFGGTRCVNTWIQTELTDTLCVGGGDGGAACEEQPVQWIDAVNCGPGSKVSVNFVINGFLCTLTADNPGLCVGGVNGAACMNPIANVNCVPLPPIPVPGGGGGNGGFGCNDQMQCVQNGGGLVCDPLLNGADCGGAFRCNNLRQCAFGLAGRLCAVDADCAADQDNGSKCDNQNKCSPLGGGIACTQDSECAPAIAPSKCEGDVCTSGGSGALCSTDSDCKSGVSKCNDRSQCDKNGNGTICTTDADCVVLDTGCSGSKCVPGGTAGPCTADAECVTNKCGSDASCSPDGDGKNCDPNVAGACEPTCTNEGVCEIGALGDISCDITNPDSCTAKCTGRNTCEYGGSGELCDMANGDADCKYGCSGNVCTKGSSGTACDIDKGNADCVTSCASKTSCVLGGGGALCNTASDCSSLTLSCNAWNQCVPGGGTRSCTSDLSCANNITHTTCLVEEGQTDGTCVSVDGEGDDMCTLGDPCCLVPSSRTCPGCGTQNCLVGGVWGECPSTYWALDFSNDPAGVCTCYEGTGEYGCDINGTPAPTVSEMRIDENRCTGVIKQDQLSLSWKYSHPTLSEGKYVLQMSSDPNFSDIVITDTIQGQYVSIPSGSTNTTTIIIEPNGLAGGACAMGSGLGNTCSLNYYNQTSETYYWRVKVYARTNDAKLLSSGWYYFNGNDHGGTKNINDASYPIVAYQAPDKPSPFPLYAYSPDNPLIDGEVQFTDASICPDANGTLNDCKSTMNTYSWDLNNKTVTGDPTNSEIANPKTTYTSAIPGGIPTSLTITTQDASCTNSVVVPVRNPADINVPTFKEVSPF